MQADTYPDDWRPAQADGPIGLVVNGELFLVSIRADGGYSSRWVSGAGTPPDGERTRPQPRATTDRPRTGHHNTQTVMALITDMATYGAVNTSSSAAVRVGTQANSS